MENVQETRRTTRLLDLIWRISTAPRQWSRKRLADQYEVSERQITKDLEVLRHGLRFPIRRSADGYFFEHVPRLPTTSFSFEEALALLLAVRAGSALAGVDGEALAAAVGRLESLFPREFRTVLRAAEAAVADPTGRTAILATLQVAVGQRRRVWLEYAAASKGGEVTERTVDPYAVIPYGKSWHLVAHCHLRDDVRLFKIDRIRQLRPLDERFPEAEFDLAEFLGRGWGLMRGVEGPVETVALRFRPPTASFVAEEVWHPTQRVEWAADGTAMFRVTVIVTPELRRWVFSYGRDVEVLAPGHLRAWVADEAHQVADRAEQGVADLAD
jgi:predicted DNA-binding transcriptional regulator YafY